MSTIKIILLIFILFVLGLFFYDVFRSGGSGTGQIDPKAVQEAIKAAGGIDKSE